MVDGWWCLYRLHDMFQHPHQHKKKDHLKQIPGAMRSSRAAHLHGVASNGAPICWVRSSDPSSLAVYGFKAVDLGEKIQVIDDDQWSMWKQVIDQTWLGNDGKIQKKHCR